MFRSQRDMFAEINSKEKNVEMNREIIREYLRVKISFVERGCPELFREDR